MGKKKLASNIWKLYVVKAFRSFSLFVPVIVLFLQENGLTMREVFILQAVFSVAVLVLEVPTGYFADRFGRKRSMIIGWTQVVAGFAIYSVAGDFFGFMAAELIIGVGVSFISGSDSALLYDTLFELGREDEYKKIEGRTHSMGLASEGAASVAGGLLALISLRTPLIGEAIVVAIGLPILFTLTEPKRHKREVKGNAIRDLLKLVKYSLHDHKELKWIILYAALMGTSTLTMVWMIQPFLKDVGLPLALFGAVWAVLMLASASFSWHAHDIEKALGKKNAFILLIVAVTAGYFMIGAFWSLWSAVFLLLFYFVRGINDPVTLDYLNGMVTSDIRATIISVRFLVGRVLFAIIGPLVGWVSDNYSMQTAMMTAGMIFFFGGVISIFFMHKHKVV